MKHKLPTLNAGSRSSVAMTTRYSKILKLKIAFIISTGGLRTLENPGEGGR
jgi:hypothetical protein